MKRSLISVMAAAASISLSTCALEPPTSTEGDTETPEVPPAIESEPLSSAVVNEQPITLTDFELALSPYGRWIQTIEYGLVWAPYDVGADWRPYANGQWTYTELGWTFVADEAWGWAPFHYGRWAYDSPFGWVWIPGYEWAPAWVAWRYGGGYIAWAPLGPESVGLDYYGVPSLWIAVDAPFFCEPLLRPHLLPTARISLVLRSTHFTGVPRHDHFFTPPFPYIAHAVGQPIVRVPAEHVAPRWVSQGADYRPREQVERELHASRVVQHNPQPDRGDRGENHRHSGG